jgi:hypothetical protein
VQRGAKARAWELCEAIDDVDRAVRGPLTPAVAAEIAANPYAIAMLEARMAGETSVETSSRRLVKLSSLGLLVIREERRAAQASTYRTVNGAVST